MSAARRRLGGSWALVLLVLAGVALRVLLWAAYSPVIVSLADSGTYVAIANGQLFSNGVQTAGYPLFLRIVHVLSNQIELTIAVQHLLGIATGLLVYAAVRRLGAPRWAALVPAAAVLLSLDQVFLEHAIMTETLFGFVLAAAAYAAIAALAEPRSLRGPLTSRTAWVLLAGLLIGLSAWIRSYTALMVPLLAVWLFFALPGLRRARLRSAGAGFAAGLLALVVYAGAQGALAHHFGLARSAGWALYARTAQFADCSQFTPPPGTAGLCERTPPSQRPGPDFYGWQPDSPAWKLFHGPPRGNAQLSAFARAAILHQPLAYAKTAGDDFLRYFAPGFDSDRPYGGIAYEVLAVNRRAGGIEVAIENSLSAYYAPDHVRIRAGVNALGDLQQFLRVPPIVLLQLILLSAVGVWRARGATRAAIALLLGMTLVLMAIPPATAVYSARYAIPAEGLLAAAGTLSLWALLAGRRREVPPVPPAPERTRDTHYRAVAS